MPETAKEKAYRLKLEDEKAKQQREAADKAKQQPSQPTANA